MKKSLYILFVAVFFLACLVPTIGMIAAGPSEAAANELPAVMPSVKNYDGSWNKAYFSGLRDYIGKGFYLRLEGITGWDRLCAGLFNTSGNEDVLIGPDGWLFFGEAVNDITGANQLSDRAIWASARSLYLMQEYAEAHGATFLFTVPCGKYTLYPEHVPSFVTVADSSNRERLAAAMEEQDVHYVDLYAAFSAAEEELYWKWDSHWNAKGAALAADSILREAGIYTNFFEGPFTEEVNHTGDLYVMLYPRGDDKESDYIPDEPYTFSYTSAFHSYDDIIISTVCDEGEKNLLMFRDSSGRNLYPYMAQTFASAHFSRLNNYRLDYVEEQDADVVVIELAERTLDYILKYPAVYPSPTRDSTVLEGLSATDSVVLSVDVNPVMEGYIKVTGTISETAVDSCVYILAGNTVYEAIPGEGCFTAWIPSNAELENAQIFVKSDS